LGAEPLGVGPVEAVVDLAEVGERNVRECVRERKRCEIEESEREGERRERERETFENLGGL
tara:strand:+ start:106 stop:288 length:183 start_codon:yes stop_codon:yes gene_type:complete